MWNTRPVRLLWHSFNWLTRIAMVAAAAVVILLAVSIVVLRYWILPDIEHYHQRITQTLSQTLGRPVAIDSIQADWQGLNPRLGLSNFMILDEQKNPALVLPDVRVSLSWLSLFSAELRFANLEINQPQLLIRRDERGQLFIGGMPVQANDANAGDGNRTADWLLHQSRMIARDALIVWLDEQRDAPPLLLEHVDLRIENRFGHHRFALRAQPPAELASGLDVRGDFRGNNLEKLEEWRGQVFTQLPYADIAAWKAWLNLPPQLSRGRGALRSWLDVDAGKLARLRMDLSVRDVATRLADNVPEMQLRSLQGRATWHALEAGFELETKKLTMNLENGVALPTTDLYLRAQDTHGNQSASGEIRANRLQLETLVSLANFVPIPAQLRTELDDFAPRGKVTNLRAQWQGSSSHVQGFLLKGKFENIAVRQVKNLPGFSRLTADIDGNQNGGTVRLDAHDMTLDAPNILREPLDFQRLSGVLNWQRQGAEWLLQARHLAASNDDVEGTAHGSYRTQTGTRGVLDLSVDLARAEVKQVARYIPLSAVNRTVNDWLHGALLGGHSEDFHLRILGKLDEFPFDNRSDEEFSITAKIRDGVVRFAADWPVVENISAAFAMHGRTMEIISDGATSAGVPLRYARVVAPDIMSAEANLNVEVQANSDTPKFLRYVQTSPVRAIAQGFTDRIQAQGVGNLQLNLRIPKLNHPSVELHGKYHVLNNEINLGAPIPLLHKVTGDVQFTQTGLTIHQLQTQMLGGAAHIDLTTTPKQVQAILHGTANPDELAKSERYPELKFLHGSAAWNAQVNVAKQGVTVNIASDLRGMEAALPAPLNKKSDDSLPLNMVLELEPYHADGASKIALDLGDLISAKMLLQDKLGTSEIKRAALNFGGQASWPQQDGIKLTGRIAELSLQGWQDVLAQLPEGGHSGVLPAVTADVQLGQLSGYGYALRDLHVLANARAGGVMAQLDSQAINGKVEWQPHGYQNGAKLSAVLKKLIWSGQPASAPLETASAAPDTQFLQPGTLPTLDVAIDDLQVNGKRIGHLELAGHPDGDAWRLRRMILTNPDGSLSGEGAWLGGAGQAQTQINVLLEISNAGSILDRSGYPNTVKDGAGKLQVDLAWMGAPQAFNLKTLQGTLKLDTGKGQFLKIDPGVGKLLSVLSLQALPKHIALDFTDVFSEGFQFDSINGNALIRDGGMSTQDFRIEGSSARVTMRGQVDLNHETQDLRVEILPSVGSGISLIGALVINPVVGISAFVMDKLLGNPLDKLVSFQYNVSGTWTDPSVVKVGEKNIPVKSREENVAPISAVPSTVQ